MCDLLVMPSLILSQIFSILFFRYCPSVQMTNLHIWSSCQILSVDSLRNLKSVFSSEDNFSIQNFFNTLNCKVFYSLHPLSRETNLTAVFISRKENKSCWKKSYTKYLVSDISRSVYVAMWNCLSRWFSCIVVIISIRNQSLIVARGQCHTLPKKQAFSDLLVAQWPNVTQQSGLLLLNLHRPTYFTCHVILIL